METMGLSIHLMSWTMTDLAPRHTLSFFLSLLSISFTFFGLCFSLTIHMVGQTYEVLVCGTNCTYVIFKECELMLEFLVCRLQRREWPRNKKGAGEECC